MNFMKCQNNEIWIIRALHVLKKDKERLLSIGIYEGAQLQMIHFGGLKQPSIVYVRGNLWMLRAKDLLKMEGEPL